MIKTAMILLGLFCSVQALAQNGVGDGGGDPQNPEIAPAHIKCDVEYNEQLGQDYLKLVSNVEQDIFSEAEFDLDELTWKADISEAHMSKQIPGGYFLVKTFFPSHDPKFTTMLVTATPEYMTSSGERLYSRNMEFFKLDEPAKSKASFTAYTTGNAGAGAIVSVTVKCNVKPLN